MKRERLWSMLCAACVAVATICWTTLSVSGAHAQGAPLIQYVLPGETGRIVAMAVAPSGTYFVTIDSYGMIYQRSCTTGAILQTFPWQSGTLTAVAITPDSTTIYTTLSAPQGANYLQAWSVATGSLVSATLLPTTPAAVSVRADGKYVAVGGKDGAIYLYAPATGTIAFKYPSPGTQPITCLTFSPSTSSASTLIAGDGNGFVYLWNTSSGTATTFNTLAGYGQIGCIQFVPTNTDLFVAIAEEALMMVRVSKKAVTQYINATSSYYPTGAISSDGTTLAVGTGSGIQLYSLATIVPLGAASPVTDTVAGLAYAPKSHNLIVAAGYSLFLAPDSTGSPLALWNVIGPPANSRYNLQAVATSSAGSEFAVASYWGVSRFQTNGGTTADFGLIENLTSTGVPPMVYSGDSSLLAYMDNVTGTPTPVVYDLQTDLPLPSSVPGGSWYVALGLPAQDSSLVTYAYSPSAVSVYQGLGSQPTSQFQVTGSSYPEYATMSPDGAFLSTWGYFGNESAIDTWNTATGSVLTTPVPASGAAGYYGPAMSNDGSLVAAPVQNNAIQVFSPGNATPLTTLKTGDVNNTVTIGSCTLSPHGSTVAAYRNDGWLDLWRVNDRTHIAYNSQLGGGVSGITFSQDESLIYVYRADGPVMVVYNPFVVGLKLSSTDLIGGVTNATGTVTIWAKSTTPTSIKLTTSNRSLTVPSSVAIPAGKTTAMFGVTSNTVTTTTYAAVYATLGGVISSVQVTVEPNVQVAAVTVTPGSLVGGYDVVGSVQLSAKAPTTGAVVSLVSNNPNVFVPATVLVLPGKKNAIFPVATGPVTQTTQATITASRGTSSASAALTLNPVTIASLVIQPSTISGGDDSIGVVSLNVPAPMDTVVTITSSSPTVAAPDTTTITIPAGYQRAGFYLSSAGVSTSKTVTFTASANGSSATATLTVTP
jgi:hypothetical protein